MNKDARLIRRFCCCCCRRRAGFAPRLLCHYFCSRLPPAYAFFVARAAAAFAVYNDAPRERRRLPMFTLAYARRRHAAATC